MSSPDIVFISSLTPGTGNSVTSSRISSYLTQTVLLVDDFTSPLPSASLYLGLHCYRAGRHLLALPAGTPSILILGGTDVNAGGSASPAEREERQRVMAGSITRASLVVAFSMSMVSGLSSVLASQGLPPLPPSRLRLLPQGVQALQPGSLAQPPARVLHALLGLPPATPLLLLVAGLREVKDPLHLLPHFPAWAAAQPGPQPVLVIVGPPLDPALTQRLHAAAGVDAAQGRPYGGAQGVYHVPAVPSLTTLAYIHSADALLNCSASEGQSQALLEAMALGTPVLARHIPGNASVVAHGCTGLLFSSPQQALQLAEQLLGGGEGGRGGRWRSALGETLARRAHAYVSQHHSESREREQWRGVVQEVLQGAAAAASAGALPPLAPSPPSYTPFSLSHLSEEQLRVSRGVRAGLLWLGRAAPEQLGQVLAVPAAAGSSSSSGSGLVWGQVGDADHARWPSAPYMYDFTGSGSGSGSGSGAPPPTAAAASVQQLLQQPNITDAATGAQLRLGWGRFHEDRTIYTSAHFTGSSAEAGTARSLHVGVDLEAPAGTPLYSPLPGTVHSVGVDRSELGYGPTLVLQHSMEIAWQGEEGGGAAAAATTTTCTFYTLYGHLSAASLFEEGGSVPRLPPGTAVQRGQVVGALGSPLHGENGGWWPHVHFQVMTELGLGGWRGDYPGVVRAVDWPAYSVLMLDPNLVLRCPFVQPVGWCPEEAQAEAGIEAVRLS